MDGAAQAAVARFPIDQAFNGVEHTARYTLNVLARTLFREESTFDAETFATLVDTFLDTVGPGDRRQYDAA